MLKVLSLNYVSRACFFTIPMESRSDKRWDIGLEEIVFLNLMLPNVNTDGSIRSEVCVKAERPNMVMAEWGSSPSDWGHDISQKRRSLLLVLTMVRKAMIDREMEKYW